MSFSEKPAVTGTGETARLLGVREHVLNTIAANAVILKFMLVGALGYIIYQFVVGIMYDTPVFWFLPEKNQSVRLLFFDHGDVRLLIPTLVATELAIIGVFAGHSRWTFRNRESIRKPLWIRFGQFNAKALVSTLGILTVTVNVLTLSFNVSHYLVVPIGVLLAFSWNWMWDTQIVWRRVKRRHAPSS